MDYLANRRLLSVTQDLGPLRFSASAFVNNGNGNFSANGPIEVGFVPGTNDTFKPLVEVDGSIQLAESADSTFTVDGTINALVPSSIISSGKIELLDSTHTFDVNDLINKGLSELDGKSFTAAGVDFTLGSIQFSDPEVTPGIYDPEIKLQGSISIAELSGLTVPVSDPNYIIIDSTGVQLTGLDVTLASAQFEAFGLTLTASQLNFNIVSRQGSIPVDDDFGGPRRGRRTFPEAAYRPSRSQSRCDRQNGP